MQETEIPLEQVHEQVEHAHHHGGSNWITLAALLSALLAVLAAVSALIAGGRVNDAMMDQMKAANQWNYYQAKGIKSTVLETRLELLSALGKEVPEASKEKLTRYAEEQKEIQEKANHFEESSHLNLESHEVFAHAVTFFQIAIAATAIAMLAKRKKFLIVSGAFGIIGAYYMLQGVMMSLHH